MDQKAGLNQERKIVNHCDIAQSSVSEKLSKSKSNKRQRILPFGRSEMADFTEKKVSTQTQTSLAMNVVLQPKAVPSQTTGPQTPNTPASNGKEEMR